MEDLIAKAILKQIVSLNRSALSTWRARKIHTWTKCKFLGDEYLGALCFKVSGLNFKGSILIGLTTENKYTVLAYQHRQCYLPLISAKLEAVDPDALVKVINGIVF